MVALRIENAGNANENDQLESQLFRYFRPAANSSNRLDRLLALCVVCICRRRAVATVWLSLERFHGARGRSAAWRESQDRVARKKGQPGDLGGGRTRPSWIEAHRLHL